MSDVAALLRELPAGLIDELADALADRLAERLQREVPAAGAGTLLDAKEVARRCGRSRDWVYEHAEDLGAIRLGDAGEGKRPRLAFEPARVDAYLARGRATHREPDAATPPSRVRRRPRRVQPATDAPLLPIKPRTG